MGLNNTLPAEIGFLIKLKELYINENNRTPIPQAICNLETFNSLIIQKDAAVSCETVSQKDALIGIYSANPDNTLGWGVADFSGVTFNADGNPAVLNIHNSNLHRLPNNIYFLEDVEVIGVNENQLITVPANLSQLSKLVSLTLEDNPINTIPQSVCNQQVSSGGMLTILTDFGEGCN
ncbi:MAG: hypothetical protein QM485_12005 [Flavobacteriaceae bacterium]